MCIGAFDPWGNGIVSTGTHTGFGMPESGRPSQAYCGSLGHRKEDETGLVYMRARYYDPQVGRFTSQDPAMDGLNWFLYCSNDPVNCADSSGRWQEVAELIQSAYNLFRASHWGSGTVETRQLLLAIVEQLKDVSKLSNVQARALMMEAMRDREYAAAMGSASEMQLKIAEIKQGIASLKLTDGVAAQMGIKVIGIMLELLAGDGGVDPWIFNSR